MNYAVVKNGRVVNLVSGGPNYTAESGADVIEAPDYAQIGMRVHRGRIVRGGAHILPLPNTVYRLIALSEDEIESLLDDLASED